MKAFALQKYAKKSALTLVDMPKLSPQGDEVLVEIHAAGVNLLDAKIRDGEFKPILPYKLPTVLGHDLAGVVVATGPNAAQFKVGDTVYARVPDFHIGTFAEYITVAEAHLAPAPAGLTMAEAASLPLVALTAWQALVDVAKVQPGQKVFVQAGSGGVGSIAIQLAKHLGAYVATTTGPSNIDLVKSLGADLVIDYRSQDFSTLLQDYDVVLHSQDAKALDKSLRVLRKGGILVSITGPATPDMARALNAPLPIRLVVHALSYPTLRKARKLGVRFAFLFMRANGPQLRQIAALVEAGVIRPVVDRVFPFGQTNAALEYAEAGRAKGKVVVAVK